MDWTLFVRVYEMFRGIFDAFIHAMVNLFGNGADNDEGGTTAA